MNTIRTTLLSSVMLATSLFAAEVTLSGYTNGAFNGGAVPDSSALQTASLLGLTYVNSTYSNTTVMGFAAVGGNPTTAPTQNLHNLGSFALSDSNANYIGSTFTLRNTFTAPTGIVGGDTALFSSTLMGQVSSTGDGGVFIDFDNTPQLFTFSYSNPDGSITTGSFQFAVLDVSIDPGQVASLNGIFTAAQQSTRGVPDGGATVALFGFCATTLFAFRRRLT